MDILALFAALQQLVADLQSKVSEAQIQLEIEKKAAFDAGFAAGVASVAPGNDKVFSQAELDEAVTQAKALMQLEIDGLKTSLSDLQLELSVVPAKIDAAIAAFKAELKVKYEEAQGQEKSIEDAFGGMLA